MLTKYFEAAMRAAEYELDPEDGLYYGRIPPCPGVWSYGETLEQCRSLLAEVLEDWVMLGLRAGDALPVVEGIDLAASAVA